MASEISCPSCGISLVLFTPRESSLHVNECLDSKLTNEKNANVASTVQQAKQSSSGCYGDPNVTFDIPTCGVCHLNLSGLTPAARDDHANRCADSLLRRKPKNRKKPGHTQQSNSNGQERKTQSDVGDPRVQHLLQLLGLGRYAFRFAAEEIDMSALRVLREKDFAELKIPEAARRRIAEALHSVPILTRISSDEKKRKLDEKLASLTAEEKEDEIVPTQKFQRSKIGERRRRTGGPLLELDSSDTEYEPTPETNDVKRKNDSSPKAEAKNESQRKNEMEKPQQAFNETRDEFGLSHSQHSHSVDYEDPPLRTSDSSENSNCSTESLLYSTPIFDGLSQIDIETKLCEWRKHRIKQEIRRHRAAMKAIEDRHQALLNSALSNRTEGEANAKEPVSKGMGRSRRLDCSPEKVYYVDTPSVENNTVENEDNTTTIPTKDLPQPIVISPDIVQQEENKLETGNQPPNLTNNSIVISIDSSDNSPNRELQDSDESDFEPLNIRGLYVSPKPCSPRNAHIGPKPTAPNCSESNDRGEGTINLISAEKTTQRAPRKQFSLSESDEEIRNLVNEQRPLPTASQYPLSESDEEIRKLVNAEKENSNTGVGAMRHLELGDTASQNLQLNKDNFASQSQTQTQTQTQSRLKRRRKKQISKQDIVDALQTDPVLYEDILATITVSFERVLECLRSAGVQISKKGLVDFLHVEGILFRGEIPQKGSAAANYLNHVHPHEY